VYRRPLVFACRRFGTMYLVHLQRLDMKCPAFEDGTDRWFRNVGMQREDAGDTPKRLLTTAVVFPTVATVHGYCLRHTFLLLKHVASLCDLNNSYVHFYVTEMCRKYEM
jgi:hypothetical protein